MQSRRSCRNYLEKPVEKTLLDDLVKIGITAPSGSNCQMWSFNVLPDRSSVKAFARRVKRFYENLNRMAEKSWLRFLLKLIRKPELDSYYENYYQRVKEGLADWDEKGKDLLFHGAPAAIIVASKEEASCPSEDALLATQNILLGAHSLGLGTCLVGFAVSAMNRDRKICDVIKLPEDESVYAVIAVGYPDEKYKYVTGRKPALIRTITLPS
jgi:nitroreductase